MNEEQAESFAIEEWEYDERPAEPPSVVPQRTTEKSQQEPATVPVAGPRQI